MNNDDNKLLDALRLALELGADYIDVELQVVFPNPSYTITYLCIIVNHSFIRY